MSDATDYLMAHAICTIKKARELPSGPKKFWLRHIGSVYHQLAKQGAYSNVAFLDDFRAARKLNWNSNGADHIPCDNSINCREFYLRALDSKNAHTLSDLSRNEWALYNGIHAAEIEMGLANYMIIERGKMWGILHDGNIENEYETKEAAFEAAVAAASLAIRQGHEVRVSVPGREAGNKTALGAKEN
jgi:hypothetical protein